MEYTGNIAGKQGVEFMVTTGGNPLNILALVDETEADLYTTLYKMSTKSGRFYFIEHAFMVLVQAFDTGQKDNDGKPVIQKGLMFDYMGELLINAGSCAIIKKTAKDDPAMLGLRQKYSRIVKPAPDLKHPLG